MSVIIELKLFELKRLLEIGPYCETDGASIHARRLFPLLSTDFIVDIIIESIYVIKKNAEKYLPKKNYRQKASFGEGIRSWISGDLRNMIDEHRTSISRESREKRFVQLWICE